MEGEQGRELTAIVFCKFLNVSISFKVKCDNTIKVGIIPPMPYSEATTFEIAQGSSENLKFPSKKSCFSFSEPFKVNQIRIHASEQPTSHATDGQIGYLLNESRAIKLATRVATAKTVSFKITRAEIFLTSACNMSCRYCLSKKHSMPEWDEKNLHALMEMLAKQGTRHLQWTGGEVTVHPRLKEFISRATELGMDNSISTNGTGGAEAYANLAQAGVRHFFISLDYNNSEIFDHITRTKGKYIQTTDAISSLCKNDNRNYRVVINSVLTREIVKKFMADNAIQLKRFLEWCVEVKADDFKFLPVSTEHFTELFPNHETMKKFIAVCLDTVPERYKFFHYRLAMLEQGGHGLYSGQSHTCYHCLDDRAYDSLGVWPCIIHLREGGKRMYRHDDPMEFQKEQLESFFHADRTQDPICQTFCFDVYRALNERVASILHPEKTEECFGE